MNKKIKLLSIVLSVILLIAMFTTVSMADNTAVGILENIENEDPTVETSGLTTIAASIINIVTVIGVVVAVVVLLVIGIKYMMGSASEKAEYKKTMIPYLVGAVLIFGASAITNVVVQLTTSITT